MVFKWNKKIIYNSKNFDCWFSAVVVLYLVMDITQHSSVTLEFR